MASVTNRPEKVCGMHFFNPPQLMKLVEVIRGARTSDETVQTVLDVAHRMEKETVLVKKDSPGFIVNRILIPALNEAVAIYWEGIADRDDIDKAIKLGLNWPMGPLMLLDYVGSDTALAIAEVLTKELDPKFHPTTGLRQMAKAQLLGRKTGKGFYDWPRK
jgi:3-hydroxybutyryl-CoA dehydrogenase